MSKTRGFPAKYKRYLFAAVTAVLFALPFGILSLHFIGVTKSISQKGQAEKSSLRVKTVANSCREFLLSRYGLIGEIKNSGFAEKSLSQKRKFLENRLEDKAGYRGFALFENGAEKFSEGGLKISPDIFRKAADSSSSVGSVEFSSEEPPALVLVEPLKKGASAKKLLLGVKISLAELADAVRDYGANLRNEVGIIDSGGQIIADSMGKYIVRPGVRAADISLEAVKKAKKSGRGSALTRNGRTSVFVSRIEGTDWWVYEISDFDDYDYYSKWANGVVLKGFIIIAVFSFITLKLAEYFLISKKGRNPPSE